MFDKTNAAEGETVTITVTPDEGYELMPDSLKVYKTNTVVEAGSHDLSITPTQDAQDKTKYTFTMPDNDVTITATFKEESRSPKIDYKKLIVAGVITSATIATVKTVDVLVKEAKAEKSAKLLEEAKTAAQQALTEAVGNSTSKTVKKYFNEGTEAVANATTPDEVMNATVEYVALIGEVKTVLGTKISQNKLTANKNGKIKVSFENPELDGTVNYQVVRSTKKDFSTSKKTYTVKAKAQKTLTYTNGKSLKKGTRYYYKVRAKVELSDGTTLYTDWSNVRYTKCKKTVK